VLAIEEQVRLAIKNNQRVFTDTVSLEPAQEVNTLRAVFGEQYPDPVRVVSIGAPVESLLDDPGRDDWMSCSVEFCGGTHLAHTGEAGAFVLLQEQGLAAGVRRIVAATGSGANAARERAQTMADSISALEASNDEATLLEDGEALLRGWEEAAIGLGDRITLRDRVDALRQRVKSARKKERSASQGDFVATARELAEKEDADAFVARLDGADRDGLLAAMDAIRKAHPERAVLLLAADEDAGSVVIVARVPDPLIKRGLAAGPWVKATAQACGGNGGGRPDSAQAGGKDPSRAGEAVDAAREHAESVL
jgi:alanyl-tRNA synthetase